MCGWVGGKTRERDCRFKMIQMPRRFKMSIYLQPPVLVQLKGPKGIRKPDQRVWLSPSAQTPRSVPTPRRGARRQPRRWSRPTRKTSAPRRRGRRRALPPGRRPAGCKGSAVPGGRRLRACPRRSGARCRRGARPRGSGCSRRTRRRRADREKLEPSPELFTRGDKPIAILGLRSLILSAKFEKFV